MIRGKQTQICAERLCQRQKAQRLDSSAKASKFCVPRFIYRDCSLSSLRRFLPLPEDVTENIVRIQEVTDDIDLSLKILIKLLMS